MDWEDRLDDWELELELGAQLDGSDWVTLEKAAAETGVSRAALRTWYRSGHIPSRLVEGPHGPQRLVPLAMVAERAEASPRVRKTAERRLADEAQIELLRHRVDQLELRLLELERRLNNPPKDLPARRASHPAKLETSRDSSERRRAPRSHPTRAPAGWRAQAGSVYQVPVTLKSPRRDGRPRHPAQARYTPCR